MFEQATLSTGPRTKRVWTTIAGFTGQALVVTSMILAPMIWPEVLPQAKAIVGIVPPLYEPPKPVPPGTTSVQRSPSAGARPALPWKPIVPPTAVPKGPPSLDEAPQFSSVPPGSGSGPSPGPTFNPDGVIGGLGDPRPIAPPPPKPVQPVAKPPEPITRIVQTSQLDMAKLLRRVDPVYPPLAKQMRVSGTVELRGVIGTDGRIRELKVLGGHPLLVKAAVDAVSQWIYEPTRLSGKPVEVDAPIIVNFKLN